MRLFVLLVFLMTLQITSAHFIVSDIHLSGHATHVIDDSFFRSNDSLHKIQFRGREFLVPPHKKSFKIAVLLPFHTDFSNQMQFVSFMKNIALAGGFLFLVINDTKDFSLEEKLSK